MVFCIPYVSEFCVVGGAGEGYYVADVCHARNEQYQALESQAETAVGYGAEAAGIEIPPHVFHGDVKLVDAGHKLVVVGLTFAAADDFADFREEYVHGADGLAVVVLLHVEGLDFLGIVGEYHGAFEVFFHQVALVFALQVGAPVYGELELAARLLTPSV